MFGEQLQALRKKAGLTQTELGDCLGLSQRAVSYYEKNSREPSMDILTKVANYFRVSVDFLIGQQQKHVETVKIPVLGKVICGEVEDAIEDILGTEEIPARMVNGGREYFALVAKGTSMQPVIVDGDIVIVQRQTYVEDGDVGVFVIDGETTLKKVRETEQGITLEAYNTDVYKPHHYTHEQIVGNRIFICGKVKEIRRRRLP